MKINKNKKILTIIVVFVFLFLISSKSAFAANVYGYFNKNTKTQSCPFITKTLCETEVNGLGTLVDTTGCMSLTKCPTPKDITAINSIPSNNTYLDRPWFFNRTVYGFELPVSVGGVYNWSKKADCDVVYNKYIKDNPNWKSYITTCREKQFWWFKNALNVSTGEGLLNAPFSSEAVCKTARANYLTTTSIPATVTPGVCYKGQSDGTIIVASTPPGTPINTTYNLPADTNKPTMDTVYTLLAPIPGLGPTAPTNIGDYFNKMLEIAIGLCAVLAVIMIVIGGIQYMGDESVFGKTEAKGQIAKAILGLLIALGSFALLNTIDPALLGKNGVNIKSVSIDIDEEVEIEPLTTYSLGENKKLCPEGLVNVTIKRATGSIQPKIKVCKTISGSLVAMLNATPQNMIISGAGFRSEADQQILRVEHGCASPSLASNECTPPTARPGYSLHQAGKAIDFNCNGNQMVKGDVCYQWLSANASKYTFYNLASEPWHWSLDGR
jgi:hypothetical protein